MKILRWQIRKAFLGASWGFAYAVFEMVKHPELAELHGEVRYYGVLTGSALLAVLYTAAVLTTGKPSPYRNNWAVAASSLSIILGLLQSIYLHTMMPGHLRAELYALIAILVGSGGLYFYAPGGSPPQPESAAKPEAPARSIQSVQSAAPAVSFPARKIPMTPTAVAPSLAASSPELAAAAASPGDPNAPWDPLAFIRSPETLQKVRTTS